MAKVALLIGVSEYEPGLNPLPSSVLDVEALQRVLSHPDMGGFAEADVTTLKNPQRQEMEDAIYRLFADRKKDDLLLLYFSGHGIKDENSRLYLATRTTRKENGRLVNPSAVAASYLHDRINDSKSQRQVIILDCCFSGAIAQGMTVKDDGAVDIQASLGGRGRAILTSSTALEYSFGSEGSASTDGGLSVYTRFLVEGIETGAADIGGDGWISVDELHEYASRQVKTVAPAMTPKFYPVEEGYKINLAKSPQDDPKLKYRKEVQARAKQVQGKFSVFAQRILGDKRREWGLSQEEAEVIQAEVLQPYREYEQKCQDYEQALREAVTLEFPFSPQIETDLQEYRQHLNLREEDWQAIEAKHLPQSLPISPSPLPSFPSDSSTPSPPDSFPEDLGNGITLDLIAIPADTFWMGQTEAEKQTLIQDAGEANYQRYYTRELPRHQVTIAPFYLGKFPVTQTQWQAIARLPKINTDLDPNPANFKGDQLPVEQVSWNEAMEFCARLSHKTGKTYRLPSEAEWEYACRAGTTTPFYFGDTISTDQANYDGNYTYGAGKKGKFRQQTTPVGTFPPNAFGLYDMHGNVWEWCADQWYDTYASKPETLKQNGAIAWTEESTGMKPDDIELRLLRGGSWVSGPGICRSVYRGRDGRGNRDNNVGFRVVCVVPGTLHCQSQSVGIG